MNDQYNVTSVNIDVDNNFLVESADDVLLQALIGLGRIPHSGEIGAVRPDVVSVRLNRLTGL